MRTVVFCEVAWMKYYAGIKNGDIPKNGGKWIKENNTGGEIYNFTPHNHICYGYVMHYGNLNFEKHYNVSKHLAEMDNVTVVWCATDGDSCKIVGWYENAKMYREWQTMCDETYDEDDRFWDYNFTANEKNCFLIPEEKRTFVVPRAPKAGSGKGMGQSHVWYADSDYAKEKFVPQVLEYLEKAKEDTEKFYWTDKELLKSAEDTGLSVDEIIEKISDIDDIYKALTYANLALQKESSLRTISLRADILFDMRLYDEAEMEYRLALYEDENNPECIINLMYVELMLGKTFVAVGLGEKFLSKHKEHEGYSYVAQNVVMALAKSGDIENAEKRLAELEKESNFNSEDIEYMKKYIEDIKR